MLSGRMCFPLCVVFEQQIELILVLTSMFPSVTPTAPDADCFRLLMMWFLSQSPPLYISDASQTWVLSSMYLSSQAKCASKMLWKTVLCCNVLFNVVFIFFSNPQDSDSPRHSTASNSSNLSSPPSPSSPHKSKSQSLERSEHPGWETWGWSQHCHPLTHPACWPCWWPPKLEDHLPPPLFS